MALISSGFAHYVTWAHKVTSRVYSFPDYVSVSRLSSTIQPRSIPRRTYGTIRHLLEGKGAVHYSSPHPNREQFKQVVSFYEQELTLCSKKSRFVHDDIGVEVAPDFKLDYRSSTYIMVFKKGHTEKEDFHIHIPKPGTLVGVRLVELFTLHPFKLELAKGCNPETQSYSQIDSFEFPAFTRALVLISAGVFHRFLPVGNLADLHKGDTIALGRSFHADSLSLSENDVAQYLGKTHQDSMNQETVMMLEFPKLSPELQAYLLKLGVDKRC